MNEQSELYWNGGPFIVGIEDVRSIPEGNGGVARELLEGFRSAVHKYFFSFGHAKLGYEANSIDTRQL